jgi:ERCC4-type nuclease
MSATVAAAILIDNREHELITLFSIQQGQAQAQVAQLPVGDVWIGSPETNEYAVVAERKSVADLESSLKDGRYREQRTRLLAFCAEKKARPLYIIEGGLQHSYQKKTLWKVLNRLGMRYGVSVMQTVSIKETAELVEAIAQQLTEDKECFKAETLSYSDVTSFQKKANKDDPENFTLAVLQQCTGVSLDKAKALLTHFKSLIAIMQAGETTLAEVKTPNGRKLGPALAKRLYTHFHFSLP